MDNELLEKISKALQERFKKTVEGSSGEPFEKSGVKLPAKQIWDDYALAVLEAIK